jgi:hypothetical protein
MKNSAKLRILIIPFIVLSMISLLLLAERFGLKISSDNTDAGYLPESIKNAPKDEQEAECLMLIDTSKDAMVAYRKQMMDILDIMRVGYDTLDISNQKLPDLSKYRTIVITFNKLDKIQDSILTIFDWVKEGGGLMFSCAPEPSTVFKAIKPKLGILESGDDYVNCSGIKIVADFMAGAKGQTYLWDEAWDSSLALTLKEGCTLHAVSVSESPTPMLWEYDYEKGRVVVNNHYLADKGSRGFLGAAYSLLEDVIAYPVINVSSFFIDDFPSPIPQGDSKFIASYGRTVDSFYTNVWWPDVLALSQKYGFTYTGGIIEDYNDSTEAPFARNLNTRQFTDFGGMLLKNGGEICLHGYNHQPLVAENFDYKDKYTYNKWKSMDEMISSLNELLDFSRSLYPDAQITTYVPPSNVLSNEGRSVLTSKMNLRCIASLYLVEDIEFEQEFDVSEDGTINLPRIISGFIIDDYMKWVAMNELNLHYVNTHFMHPDDVLDEDRGAELGWEVLKGNFESYLNWLYTTAPKIRNMNASQASAAVERYHYLNVKRTVGENEYKLSIGGFYDSAYLMVRINEGTPGAVKGGTLEKLEGNLYVLHATSAEVTIELAN